MTELIPFAFGFVLICIALGVHWFALKKKPLSAKKEGGMPKK